MQDYEPLALNSFCNAGKDALGPDRTVVLGHQVLHGLPFQIGSENSTNCFVVLGGNSDGGAVTIPIERKANCVIFAHVQLDSRLHEGDPVGRVVASYTFVLENGECFDVPIRERFKIASVPTGWGELPFLAVPDVDDRLRPRFEGE